MQGFLAGLTCIHDDARGDKSAEHPVVRTHPDTGRPALFVNKQFSPDSAVVAPSPRCCCRTSSVAGAGPVPQPGGGGRLAMS